MNKESRNALSPWLTAKAISLLFAVSLLFLAGRPATAQDQDDPPARVARLGYMQGSVSFEPAGENDWVQADANRPMTTGDKLWADQNSRAEVQLGSSMIDLSANTGFSFLNLDDRTVQMEITAGAINVRVWQLNQDNVYEIDTPNQAFTVTQPGRYRIETSENGDSTVVTIWEGEGQSTGNGQTYTLHAGQRTTFSGTNTLNAEVEQIGNPDDFDQWSVERERRYDDSRSSRYLSRDVVGYEDLDANGDWQSEPEYGDVWFPRVNAGWAPYHEGHWAWIDPWGWTWVDDDPWGYAPFHYGRWAWFQNRWGWVPGPRAEYPVYAPALVAFVGGAGFAFGGNIAWFPLGPREVYVPTYAVSQAYVSRVNISNTVVNQTTITNVYNTTIVNKSTTITNVNYVNRGVQGAVTAVPQQAFASAQPVQRAAVRVNPQDLARAPVGVRAAVPPAQQAVLGAHASTAGHVAAPPAAIAQRQVIAKTTPPPAPPPFSARQQMLAKNPGEPLPRQQLQKLASAAPNRASMVRTAPPGKPATPTPAPANRAATPSPNAQPNRPSPASPAANRPEPNRPETNQPAPNRPETAPERNNRPPTTQPEARPQPTPPAANRPQPNQPTPNRAEPNRPEPNRPETNQPNRVEPNRPETNREAAPQPRPEQARPEQNRPAEQPARPPAEARPAQPPPRQQAKPPEQKKQEPKKPDEKKPDDQPHLG